MEQNLNNVLYKLNKLVKYSVCNDKIDPQSEYFFVQN